jgi:hypothetical protein
MLGMASEARAWLLPAATLVGVLLAAALATLHGGLHGGLHRAPAAREAAVPRPATATIVESVPCAQHAARDIVVLVIDGSSYRLPLDACGNPEGIRLDVELVTTGGGEPAVRLAGIGAAPHDRISERFGALLLVLSALAGALLAVLVSPYRMRGVRRD